MTGYEVGPTLPHDVEPWPLGWENSLTTADCVHAVWESVLLDAGPKRGFVVEVVRCRQCHAPRCGHSGQLDPCMRVRHHHGQHVALSGEVWPLGGTRRTGEPHTR